MIKDHTQSNSNTNLLHSLLSHGRECEWIEFKQNNSNPQIIGRTLSALSNSAFLHDETYGYLVYGIQSESLEIVGTQYKPKENKVGSQEIENWLATQLDPRIDFRIIEFGMDEGQIVIFKVDSARSIPVSFKGEKYVRIGSYTKPLKDHPEVEKKIWLKASEKSFETRIAKASLTDDQALNLLDYVKYFSLSEQPLPSNKESLITKLEEERIIVPEGGAKAITNLGAILFSKNLKEFDSLQRRAVRVIVYKEKDRLNATREHEWVKGYATGFEELIRYIMSQLPSYEEIEGALRKEIHAFPELAIRELVANMLIHQDFGISGMNPMVEIFSDRIEISNPGSPLIDTMRFLDHNPRSRNEKLAAFMRRIRICEERGSGVDKIMVACERNHLPAPHFIREDQYLKAILYGPKLLKEMTRTDKILTTYFHCGLKYMSNDVMTNKSLRERLGLDKKNYSTASRIIKEVLKEELIRPYDPENKSPKYMRYIPYWS